MNNNSNNSNCNSNNYNNYNNSNIIKKNIVNEIYSEGYKIAQYGVYMKKLKPYKTFKIPVDARCTCPNKDGNIDTKGCIFCPKMGRDIVPPSCNLKYSLKEQIETQLKHHKIKGLKKFYIYFYPATNTYGDLDKLKELWDFALSYKDVIGLSLGTRPDCLNGGVLDILEEYVKQGKEIWIDLGIQTMNQKTLDYLNRGHTVEDTENAIKNCKKRNIFVCGHIILGLPNEGWKNMMDTAYILGDLEIDALKIYPLLVLKNTELEQLYWKGKYSTLDKQQYVKLVCDFLERSSPYTIIQRILKDRAPKNIVISPKWNIGRLPLLNEISNELKKRGTKQGFYFNK
ncbi:TIGR01212 family radical SAM protein [Methanococcus aeolicus]|uniref:TIGR01212 family radical SAM protein n=1 Tax=Methanococcus aeolicus TaxID=42879 RepID=UPI0021CA7A9C|nr:TIGR01212 family radical SAM protein [Methanococcus aeolicus]UXM84870.1 TIGR01212 family radical SAM protein [Methanococcus aeolicus]